MEAALRRSMAAAASNVTEHLAGERVSLTWPAALLRRMDAFVAEGFGAIPRGGVEVGGVLFGKREPDDTLALLEYRPIACEYSTGPSFVLSPRDRAGIAELLRDAAADPELAGLVPVAWFHSHTRSDLTWTKGDAALHASCFPGLAALILRPGGLQPTEVGVFVPGADGTIAPGSPAEVFLIERRRRSEQPEAAAPVAIPPEAVEAPASTPPARAPLILAIGGALAALLLMLAWHWYTTDRGSSAKAPAVFGVPAIEPRRTEPPPASAEAAPETEDLARKPESEPAAAEPAAEAPAASRNRDAQLLANLRPPVTQRPAVQPSDVAPPSISVAPAPQAGPLPGGLAPSPTLPAPPPPRRAPASGRAIWTGSLPRGGTLTIAGGRAQSGSLTGRWPEGPARVRVHAAELAGNGMVVYTGDPALRSRAGTAESPSARNGWNLTTWQWDPKRAAAVQVVEQPAAPNGRLTLRSGANVGVLILEWDELPQP